jgi:hypothetical protein
MHLLAVCLFLQSVAPPDGIDCSMPQSPEKNAICLKKASERRATTLLTLQQDAARYLKKGDRYYRQGNFGQAYKAYDLARLNAPTAYASLRAGDALFAGIATAKVFHTTDGKPAGQCYAAKDYLFTVDYDLPNLYETGIELHKILAAGPPVPATMLAQTSRKMACLRTLAARYRQAQTACVDLPALRACVMTPQTGK